jgi:hypothetical protein
MKKGIISILCIAVLGSVAQAQSTDAPPPPPPPAKEHPNMTPEKVAEHRAAKAQTELGLNDQQKSQFQGFELTRINAVKPLREKAKATQDQEEKKKLRAEAKTHFQTFDTNVKSILTPDQLVKWEDHKKKMREQHKPRKGKTVPRSKSEEGDDVIDYFED